MSDLNYSSDDCFSSNSNGGSSGNEADFEEEEAYGEEMNKILNRIKTFNPYIYEPEKSSSDTDSSNDELEINGNSSEENYVVQENSRVGNVDWCKCGGNCKIEKRDIDCLCCQEVHALNLKFDAENNIRCITESKDFEILCTNKTVLEVIGF